MMARASSRSRTISCHPCPAGASGAARRRQTLADRILERLVDRARRMAECVRRMQPVRARENQRPGLDV
jgi:hypothetical protein